MGSPEVDPSLQALMQLTVLALLCPRGQSREENLLQEIAAETVADENHRLARTLAGGSFGDQICNETGHFDAGRGQVLDDVGMVDGEDPAVGVSSC